VTASMIRRQTARTAEITFGRELAFEQEPAA
jgi:hypothetical protein